MHAFGYALLRAGPPGETVYQYLSFSGQLIFGLPPLIRYSAAGQVNKFQYFKSIGRALVVENLCTPSHSTSEYLWPARY